MEPTPISWLTCNYDASYHTTNAKIGAGWTIRDSGGGFITAASSFMQQKIIDLQAEGYSLLHVIQTSWFRGYWWIIFEGDSQTLVDLI